MAERSSTSDTTDEPAETPDALPAGGVRTTLTLLLLLHLFMLMVAVAANFGTPSGFRRSLRDETGFVAYLNLLHMDLAYNYHFTFGMQDDVDHLCDVVLDTPPGFQGTRAEVALQKVVPMMPEGCWPGMRRRRYLMLGYMTGAWVDDDEFESLLPSSISAGLLAQQGVDEGKHRFRCRVLQPLPLYELELIPEDERDPFHANHFANVLQYDVVGEEGRWVLVKVATRGEVTQTRPDATEDKPEDKNDDTTEDK